MIEIAQDNTKQPNDSHELLLRKVFDSTVGKAILKHSNEPLVRSIWIDALNAFPTPKIKWGRGGILITSPTLLKFKVKTNDSSNLLSTPFPAGCQPAYQTATYDGC